MSNNNFEPCGSRHVDGQEMIRRIAAYLDVSPEALAEGLKTLALGQLL